MGAASGGRLTLWLMTLAVLMASGAAGVAMVGPGREPAARGSGRDTRMLGSALSQSGAVRDTAPATAPGARPSASGSAPGGLAQDAAGRFNVAAPHSPELLQLLAAAAAESGPPGNAGQPAKASTAPSTAGPGTTGPSTTAPGGTAPSTAGPGETAPGETGPDRAGPDGTAPDRAGSGETGPRQTAWYRTARYRTTRDQTAPDETGSAGAGPDGTAPDRTAPGGTAPDGTAPDGTGPGASTPTAAQPPGAVTEGVDVAAAQHPGGAPIDWTEVAAAGYTFAAIKSTEGDYYTNPYGAADLAGAKAAGLYVTGYHFAIPNVSGGAAQADFAVSHGAYAAGGRTSRLELDIEYDPYTGTDHTNACYGLSPAQMVSWISAFGAETQRLTGQRPVIYTTAAWWATCTGDSTAFGADPLWVAAPGPAAPADPAGQAAPAGPAAPAGWTGWALWQFTSGGTVPGICSAGNTDVSEADGSPLTLLDPGTPPGATSAAVPAPAAGASGRAAAPTGS